MLVMLLVVFGAGSYPSLGIDLYPDIELPIVTVTITYTGASPEEMESLVSKPIEDAVSSVAGTSAKIVDTRKSTPGLRVLEKHAVRVGGGHNHRFNLSDGVLIKDNHIAAAGGIAAAVNAARAAVPHVMKIEVETETLDEVRQALEAGADIIMLDNMSIDLMAQSVALIGGKALAEASGNMGEKDLLEVAKTGVDYISIGALTHSVKSLDISLKFKK